jgi:formiminoglutamase
MTGWLQVRAGDAPLVVSLPHTGTDIPGDIAKRLVSPWLARKDADWWLEKLHAFAVELDATVIRTTISRTVIDVNRDPSGASLYPGQATTELCPTTTFDGEPLYLPGEAPEADEIAWRRAAYFDPYRMAIADALARLGARHQRVVLYDAHSIRSVIPRLFEGELPHFNIGTAGGVSCDPALTALVEHAVDGAPFSRVTNGRFKGGHITRAFGRPEAGLHAIQMETACRAYMVEPATPDTTSWPSAYDPVFAAPAAARLRAALEACLTFARSS